MTTEGTLSGFQDFFLQPIIKDRPNIDHNKCRIDSNHVLVSLVLSQFIGSLRSIFLFREPLVTYSIMDSNTIMVVIYIILA